MTVIRKLGVEIKLAVDNGHVFGVAVAAVAILGFVAVITVAIMK